MMNIAVAVALLLISGCASTLTEDEAFEKEQARMKTTEQFYTCKQYYSKWGVIWQDRTGTANARLSNRRKPPIWAMKQQMAFNNHCKRILRALEMD